MMLGVYIAHFDWKILYLIGVAAKVHALQNSQAQTLMCPPFFPFSSPPPNFKIFIPQRRGVLLSFYAITPFFLSPFLFISPTMVRTYE